MSKIVRFTKSAEQDFETIGDWIARDNPNRAILFVRDLRTKCMKLGALSERFARFLGPDNVRKRAHGKYVIFYRVNPDAVEILHIFHGSMNVDEADFESENSV